MGNGTRSIQPRKTAERYFLKQSNQSHKPTDDTVDNGCLVQSHCHNPLSGCGLATVSHRGGLNLTTPTLKDKVCGHKESKYSQDERQTKLDLFPSDPGSTRDGSPIKIVSGGHQLGLGRRFSSFWRSGCNMV